MTVTGSGIAAAGCLALTATFTGATAQPHDHSPPPRSYHCQFQGRNVPIVQAAGITSAMATYVGTQPRIYISPVFVDMVGPVTAKFVAAHECAHVRNGDVLPQGRLPDLAAISRIDREYRADRDGLTTVYRQFGYREPQLAQITADLDRFVEQDGDHPFNADRRASLYAWYARLDGGRVMARN